MADILCYLPRTVGKYTTVRLCSDAIEFRERNVVDIRPLKEWPPKLAANGKDPSPYNGVTVQEVLADKRSQGPKGEKLVQALLDDLPVQVVIERIHTRGGRYRGAGIWVCVDGESPPPAIVAGFSHVPGFSGFSEAVPSVCPT